MTSALHLATCDRPQWPKGATAAISLTFDVDVDADVIARKGTMPPLGAVSEALFGIIRGLPRITALLAKHEVPATFFVPGEVAVRHPDAVRAIAGSGHEIAHHGHRHIAPAQLSLTEQRDELERGIEALSTCAGTQPSGYRAPCWEPTWETLSLLPELGFEYDSSLMHDDRPYLLRSDEGVELLELPVHWSLDDWALFGWEPGYQGTLSDAASLAGAWKTELEATVKEGQHVTYTMHPEVIGRRHRIEALDAFLAGATASGAWFATHAQIAAFYQGGSRNKRAAELGPL